MRYSVVLGFVLLSAGVIVITQRESNVAAIPAPPSTPSKWEYHAATEADLIGLTEAKTIEAGMNKLGDEGGISSPSNPLP